VKVASSKKEGKKRGTLFLGNEKGEVRMGHGWVESLVFMGEFYAVHGECMGSAWGVYEVRFELGVEYASGYSNGIICVVWYNTSLHIPQLDE